MRDVGDGCTRWWWWLLTTLCFRIQGLIWHFCFSPGRWGATPLLGTRRPFAGDLRISSLPNHVSKTETDRIWRGYPHIWFHNAYALFGCQPTWPASPCQPACDAYTYASLFSCLQSWNTMALSNVTMQNCNSHQSLEWKDRRNRKSEEEFLRSVLRRLAAS